MKKNILLLALIVLTFLLVGAGFTFQNEPDGFRKFKWGDPPTEDMIPLITQDPRMKKYELPNEKLNIGNAQLSKILYLFWKIDSTEKLMWVMLQFEGEYNYDLLKAICEGKFGTRSYEDLGALWWDGPITAISLSHNSLILMSYQFTEEFAETGKKEEAEKAEEDW